MQRATILLLLLLLATVTSQASIVRAFESITVSTTAIGFDPTTLTIGQTQVIACNVTVEGADIRYRNDGTAPTATVGQLLVDGQSLTVEGFDDATALRFIRDAGVNATVQGSCWR